MSASNNPVTQSPGQQSSQDAVTFGPSGSLKMKKRFQNQLICLLHAQECRNSPNQSNEEEGRCYVRQCGSLKILLTHLNSCREGTSCDTRHCATSRVLLSHWQNCTNSDCHVCLPAKQAFEGRKSCSNSDCRVCFPVKQASECRQRQAGVVPDNPATSKDWHQSVTQDLRYHLVRKMIHAIYPTTDISELQDKRMISLVRYIISVERFTYGYAKNKDEYYEFLTENLFNILKKLEETRQERKEMRIQQQVGPGPILSNNSSAATPKFPPTSFPLPPATSLTHLSSLNLLGSLQRMPLPDAALPTNTAARDSGLVSSSGSQSSSSISADSNVNPSRFNQAQAQASPFPPVSLQPQQLYQAHFNNRNTPVTMIASLSVDSSAIPSTLSGISVSQFSMTFPNQPTALQSKSSAVSAPSSTQVFNVTQIKQISSRFQKLTIQAPGTTLSQAQLIGIQALSRLPPGLSLAPRSRLQIHILQFLQNSIDIRSQQSDVIIQQSRPPTAMHSPVAAAAQPASQTSPASETVAPQMQKQVEFELLEDDKEDSWLTVDSVSGEED